MRCILNKIKKICLIKFFKKNPDDLRIQEYREAGIEIGEKCKIYSILSTRRDCTLLHIGNNVTISGDCMFLLHDNAIIKPSGGGYTDLLGEIRIGDNCFVGARSILLPGVNVASNTIIGAGSVVTCSVEEEGLVIAGNPARVVCSVEEYYKKNKTKAVNLDGMSKDDIAVLCKKEDVLIKRRAMK